MPWIWTRIDPPLPKRNRKGPSPKYRRVAVVVCDRCGREVDASIRRWFKWGGFPLGDVFCGRTCSGKSKIANAIAGNAASWLNDEYRAHQIERLSAARRTPEARSAAGAAMKVRRNTAEWHTRMVAGTKASWADPEMSAKRRQQLSAIHNRPEVKQQKRSTMRANATFRSSSDEDRMARHLAVAFSGNVRRSVELNGWEIDFYIPAIDTYVQMDGEYWHGLSRTIAVIAASGTVRDNAILVTAARDQEQVKWCVDRRVRLVRITDRQLRRLEKAKKVHEWISSKLYRRPGMVAAHES